MNKVTYLFGAGASHNALPIVEEIPHRINDLINFLEQDKLRLDDKTTFNNALLDKTKSKRDYQIEMVESLKWMMERSSKHASIDTFAKKLYIKEKYPEIEKLKIAISIFFIFEQARNKPDMRYDTFFSSLIESLIDFPENIRIISWNYDYQFEISFAEYSDNPNIFENQEMLRVKTRNDRKSRDIGFGIYKLNGTTGLTTDRGWRHHLYASNLNVPIDIAFVDKITQNFAMVTYQNKFASSLSFAWEEERKDNTIVDRAIESIKDSIVLVVIGYSFPFFNRNIDRKIINSMNNLKKVYFQAPDAEVLEERFKSLRDDLTNIILYTKYDIEQFLIPNEL